MNLLWHINISAAGAVDREFSSGFLDFSIFLLDFGLREVSQRRDLEILPQMSSGRPPDDFKKLRSGTGTITNFPRFEDFL